MQMKLTDTEAQALTDLAFSILLERLRHHNNQPSEKLQQALVALLDSMTQMAQGTLRGRWAFGLQTGLGKTTCAVAWLTALARLGLAGRITVAVASMEVQALCEMWDKLASLGVPMEQVGLLHSKPNASHKTTPEATARPILLLCHARVRTKFLDQFRYAGEMRDLLIYDESLVSTHSSTCASSTLTELAFAMAGHCSREEEYQEKYGDVSVWLTEVENAVAQELKRLTAISSTQSVVLLPQRPQETLDRFSEVMAGNETVQSLIKMVPGPVKVSNFADKGVLTFQVSVPAALQNIIILDASNPIRDLVRFDKTVMDAEEHLPRLKALGVSLASLKRYDGTTIHQMKARGGKTAMKASFRRTHSDQRQISKEVVEVLKRITEDQATLVIVFKPIYEKTGLVNFVKIMEDDITASGVATMKHQDSVELVSIVGDGGRTEKKPRVSITTWGLHKGTNQYTHCKNLVMVGIIHRDLLDLFGNLNGQLGDISLEQTRKRLMDLQLSEVAHDAFQAIGRIQCRTVVEGVALPVNVWLIHYSKNLQEKLEPVLQGAAWKKWETKYDDLAPNKEPGVILTAARAINEHLIKLAAAGQTRTSSKALRKSVRECLKLKPDTLSDAISKALDISNKWLREGRGLVYGPGLFVG
jgi:hypothetical protein